MNVGQWVTYKELVHLDVVLAIARNTTHWSSEL